MAVVRKLEDMRIDEVSLVRRPANQHAAIVFSKSDEGDDMPGTLYLDDGTVVDIDDLEVGTQFEDENGTVWQVEEQEQEAQADDGAYDEADVDDLDDADDYGKSDDYAELISKAYQDAVTDDERAALFAEVATEAAIAKSAASRVSGNIAKMQADAYVEECVSKADEYGFAGDRTELLGSAIAKMLPVLDEDEIELMDDIFKAFSELIDEVALGSESAGGSDVMDVVAGHANEIVKSAEGEVSPEQAMAAAFEANPDLYAMYLDEKGEI